MRVLTRISLALALVVDAGAALGAPRSPSRLIGNGPSLQRIQVGSAAVGRPLGIGGGPTAVAAGMSPADLADLAVEEIRATVAEVQVVERAGPPS